MAKVQSLTSTRMLAIEASSVVGGTVDASGYLILKTRDGASFNAGMVRGPAGSGSQAYLQASSSANLTLSLSGVGTQTSPWSLTGSVANATQAKAGVVRLATQDEFYAGNSTVAVTAADIAGVGLFRGYLFQTQRVYTASATFNKADFAGANRLKVICVGGGAAGGGAAINAAGASSSGSGGGSGAYAEAYLEMASLPDLTYITVGTGGVGVVGGTGGGGTTSSFGSFVLANGGYGGTVSPSSALAIKSFGGLGGLYSFGTGVNVNDRFGYEGEVGENGGSAGVLGSGGNGGSSRFGSGGRGAYTGSGSGRLVGFNAAGYGGGGGGGASNAGSTLAINGGNGTSGVVIVEVYI